MVALGGGAVLAAIALIFLFLIWVVLPIFAPARVERLDGIDLPDIHPVGVFVDDSFATASLITRSGELIVLNFGQPRGSAIPAGRYGLSQDPIRAVRHLYPARSSFALLTDKHRLHFHRIARSPGFQDGETAHTSGTEALFAAAPLTLDDYIGADIADFDVFRDGERLLITLLDTAGTAVLLEFPDVDDFLPLAPPRMHLLEQGRGPSATATANESGPIATETGKADDQRAGTTTLAAANGGAAENKAAQIFIGPGGRWLYRFSASGTFQLTDITKPERPVASATGRLIPEDSQLTALAPMVGRYSMLVGDQRGIVTQWSLRRSGPSQTLSPVREFHFDNPIVRLIPEPRRKGFVALTNDNFAHLAHTTAHRKLASFAFQAAHSTPLGGFSANADGLLLAGTQGVEIYSIKNHHPEISWSTLWRQVWYEGYDEPTRKWQSSAADTDFEPKFSLTPLLFGTLKAAFYAMLFAIPLAVLGAVYTACFMSDELRRWVKPGIELVAGLPTVVLGFLAGIWLAPLVENQLAAVLLCALALPLGVLLFARCWTLLPNRLTNRCEGWLPLLTVALLSLIGLLVFAFDATFEALLFDGDTRFWLQRHLGLGYDQRNALVIGMAMGLATMPIIFSIAEQALHGVPAHLAQGSLALGATRWQTVRRIVLLTAAPGIFAAVMVGVGRALGETMIVLMASGNTPIMDMNLFEGLRTFTANIAVELPEAQVGSTHYRILFLIALLLFAMTFVFNTAAELVRERLRIRYARL